MCCECMCVCFMCKDEICVRHMGVCVCSCQSLEFVAKMRILAEMKIQNR